MHRELSLGFSPCPNDTYIFHALVHNRVPLHHVAFLPPVLDDVETLNRWALEARLDVTKLSFHALGHVLDRYVMLSAGAALGRGCGPLLVSRPGCVLDPGRSTIAIPGTYTTAALLLKLFEPQVANLRVMRFEEIMPTVAKGRVDAGVIIHESRFTYSDHGLVAVQDLGEWWEELTDLPIPLGCIAAKTELPEQMITEVDSSIRASLMWAGNHPGESLQYIRSHAQEMEDTVLQSHIALYVNEYSLDIGDEGRAAIRELLRRGIEAGIFPSTGQPERFLHEPA